VDVEVCLGSPPERIVEHAAREPDTLIALATHGYSGLRRWALGSVTDRVIQTAAVPILVVRSSAHSPAGDPVLRRIMVPLDGSDMARCALPTAIALARSTNAEIIILQAVVPRTQYAGLLLKQRNQATQALGTLACGLRQQQVAVTPAVVVDHNQAAEAIIDEAARRQVNLIVMATHGYGGWQRWMLGSVADKVLQTTTTPVLLIRAQSGAA
jgi:nucleotide-binding universal stress UspA family protein